MQKVLYKYRAINEYTEKIFSDNEFWYSKIESLNDPNEGMVRRVSAQLAEEFIRKTKENQLSGFIFSRVLIKDSPFFGLNKHELRNFEKQIRSKRSFDKKYNFINNFMREKTGRRFSSPEGFINSINEKINNVGILSLSDNPLQNLLWSHYAESHSGIAVGISGYSTDAYKKVIYNETPIIPEVDLERFNSILKIYQDHTKFEIAFNDPALQTILLTKTVEWAYESEWRGISETAGAYSINGLISEIIFGLKCKEEHKQKIISLLKANNINAKLKQVYKKDNSYGLFLKEYK